MQFFKTVILDRSFFHEEKETAGQQVSFIQHKEENIFLQLYSKHQSIQNTVKHYIEKVFHKRKLDF